MDEQSDLWKLGPDRYFLECVDTHAQKLYSYLFGLGENQSLATEIAEDTLGQAYQGLLMYAQLPPFPLLVWPWVKAIAYHLICDHWNHHGKFILSASAVQESLAKREDPQMQPEQVVEDQEAVQLWLTLLQQLPPRARTALKLRCFAEQEYAEIAKALQVNEATARKIVERARKALLKRHEQATERKGNKCQKTPPVRETK
jgi:RNA polymerase sigma factor (sigma-70 family)